MDDEEDLGLAVDEAMTPVVDELARHQDITAATGMPIYFCHPKSPWQRPSNENTNGLVRQYLAKSADLRTFTQRDLDAVAAEINDRPRRIHNYRRPSTWSSSTAPAARR